MANRRYGHFALAKLQSWSIWRYNSGIRLETGTSIHTLTRLLFETSTIWLQISSAVSTPVWSFSILYEFHEGDGKGRWSDKNIKIKITHAWSAQATDKIIVWEIKNKDFRQESSQSIYSYINKTSLKVVYSAFSCLTLGYKYFIHSVARHESIPRNVRRNRIRCGWSLLVIIYH